MKIKLSKEQELELLHNVYKERINELTERKESLLELKNDLEEILNLSDNDIDNLDEETKETIIILVEYYKYFEE